ncbi:S8 family serine peptidase [Iamia sp.]|uniref:S8 family serine peptidase n=1 Tax=Iamia sp. TaxID=2722710 RepID=UPI002C7F30F6|nr:S8 family serine peptidase [Iamia sp.]HXH57493.1 S8 family serine peptidase [Iamia sp.]
MTAAPLTPRSTGNGPRRRPWRSIALTGALLAAPFAVLGAPAPSSGAPAAPTASVADGLAVQLRTAPADVALPVFVHGTDIAAARGAVTSTGMRLITTWDKVGVAVAAATPAQVDAARTHPGVTYLEGDQPIDFQLATSNDATRGDEARAGGVPAQPATPLDGGGVSVAVIDSGVDGTHPFFRGPDGRSAVVRNLKGVCVLGTLTPVPSDLCFADLTAVNDTDTLSVGGHGTHVAGIVAGRPVRTTGAGAHDLNGAAPGASIVSLSVGAAISILGADTALNWVLENHEAPCGAGVSATVCPPIKVTNNSYGPAGGGEFDPESATVKIQRALAAEGVVTVWAAGNDGGDGSGADQGTNPPGQDPTPGVLMVASYDDDGTGTRDGVVSDFSSRGADGELRTYPDVSAPGTDIESSCRPYLVICGTGLQPVNGPGLLDVGTFNTISGTSMAAPHVAGIVAQLFQADPTTSAAEVEAAINGGAHKFTDGAPYSGTDDAGSTSFDKGHGLIDVVAAVARLGG